MTDHVLPTPPLVPHVAPTNPYARLLLFGIRRMAAGGIGDAHAAHSFFIGFGLGYRRPLVLLRAFMSEVARLATVKLLVAPCCCPRMSDAEAILLDAITDACANPRGAHEALTNLLHVRECLGLVTSAQAVAQSFTDLCMPLTDDGCMKCNRDDMN